MSLTIRIRNLYEDNTAASLFKNLASTSLALSNANDSSLISNVNFVPRSSLIECKLKIYYDNPSNGKQLNLIKKDSNDLLNDEGYYNDRIVYYLNDKSINYGDRLEILCFRPNKFAIKPFAKYTMLLDFLLKKEDDITNNSKISIDDYLVDPKTNKTLSKKISFELTFENPSITSKILKSNSDQASDIDIDEGPKHDYFNKTHHQSIAFDYIRTILKTGEFSLNKFNLIENESVFHNKLAIVVNELSDEAVKNWIKEVALCSSTLNLALNLIMSYELNFDQKAKFKKSVIKNNLSFNPKEANEIFLPNLLTQIFYTDLNDKIYNWQVRVRIVELKLMLGVDETVYCIIEIGDQKFRTKEKSIANLEYYDDDETFIARLESKVYQKAFNYKITISVYFKRFLYSDVFVGKFQVDFGTIYRQPGHEARHKWGELFAKIEKPLNDDKDEVDQSLIYTEFESRGFVKFDAILQSKGDKIKIQYDDHTDEDNDIENNILVPYGLSGPTETIKLSINIYNAHILVKNQQNLLAHLKSNSLYKTLFGETSNDEKKSPEEVRILIPNENEDIKDLNTFIRVTYAGITKHTPVIKSTNKPEWNCPLEFTLRYPSLVRLFKIELCNQESLSSVQILAREYLVLNDISNYHHDFKFLPTYGPSYIDLYNEPNNMRIKAAFKDLNEDDLVTSFNTSGNSYTSLEARGSFYVASLLIGISSLPVSNKREEPQKIRLNKLNAMLRIAPPIVEYVCYIVIDECTMINQRYLNGDVNFQLCIGKEGYNTNKSDNLTEKNHPIQLSNTMPVYLSYEKEKPCLMLRFKFEDMRLIMYKINFINNKLHSLIEVYSSIKSLLWKKYLLDSDITGANEHYDKFRKTVDLIKQFIKIEFLKKNYISDYNRFRIKQIKLQLVNLVDVLNLIFRLVNKFKRSKANEGFKFYIDLIVRNSLIKIKKYLNEPLSYFPDVSLWLLFNDEPVGACNLKSHDVIWSPENDKKGFVSGVLINTDFKSLKQTEFEDPEYKSVARVKLFTWLGVIDQVDTVLKEKIKENNFEFNEDQLNELGLPKFVYYDERHTFQLNAYLYQGRDMLLLDIAGESDPYARISLYNQSVYSKTIDNTVNPTWNQQLTMTQLFIYGKLKDIIDKPPEVIVDIYDEDPFNQREFMGRFYAKPCINLTRLSKPPRLQWYKLNYNNETSGDILASFELIYLDAEETRGHKIPLRDAMSINFFNSVSHTIGLLFKKGTEIPKSITPRTRPYIFEISYWGLRNIQDSNYITLGQQKICVQVEIGDKVLEPNIIEKCASNGNFAITHRRYEILLPEEDEYKPHLNIRCECYGSLFLYSSLHKDLETIDKQFSRKILIGSCTIKSIGDYCCDNTQLRQFCRHNTNRNFIHSISVEDNLKKENLGIRRIKKSLKRKKSINYDFDLDLDYLDWWSKYFESINNESEKKKQNNPEITEIEEASGVFVKRRWRDRRNSFIALTQKIPLPTEIKKIKTFSLKQVQTIQIYDCELEKKFSLNETIEKFNLIVGKRNTVNKRGKFQCQFKGKFMLYDEKKIDEDILHFAGINGGFLKRMPHNLPVKVKVHVYIVKVSIVNPIHMIGKFEPFISIEYGQNEIEQKFKNDSIEPFIGKCFDLEVNFPEESQISISIKNWNILEGTELIGETTIDLEDRLYSNCYATCGLPTKFDTSGYNAWRDCLLPKDLLFKMCRKFGLPKPSFTNSRLVVYDINNKPYYFPDNYEDATEFSDESDSEIDDGEDIKEIKLNKYEHQLALDALNCWRLIAKVQLVPEHIETRSLYNPESGPELEQGKIQMWIDIFPMNNYKPEILPKPIDVALRKPKRFQLRIVIKKTSEVILDDTNPITGEKKSDIYIKAFLYDQEKEYQQTDVHYNSFTGEGLFNWRFVFDFDYLPAEKKIVMTRKQRFGFSVIESKTKPVIVLQCYDADNFSADDLLGNLHLDLSKFMQGSSADDLCTLKMLTDPKWPKINLFKKKTHKGWWPFTSSDGSLTGKLEAEFQLLSEKEVEKSPAGKGHDPPQALERPTRPENSFLWFTRPYQAFKFVIWKNYWKKIVLGFIIGLLMFGVLIFFVQMPTILLNKVLG